jgi:hypothetical protein
MNEKITVIAPLFYAVQNGKYCYVLTRDLVVHISAPWAQVQKKHALLFKGKILATIHKGKVELFRGYAIDGATCAPDYREGMLRFYLHDLFYQFLKTFGSFWTRKEADSVFLMDAPPPEFEQSVVYYYGVRAGGWLFNRRNKFTAIRIIEE